MRQSSKHSTSMTLRRTPPYRQTRNSIIIIGRVPNCITSGGANQVCSQVNQSILSLRFTAKALAEPHFFRFGREPLAPNGPHGGIHQCSKPYPDEPLTGSIIY